jgi:hypothetical protein
LSVRFTPHPQNVSNICHFIHSKDFFLLTYMFSRIQSHWSFTQRNQSNTEINYKVNQNYFAYLLTLLCFKNHITETTHEPLNSLTIFAQDPSSLILMYGIFWRHCYRTELISVCLVRVSLTDKHTKSCFMMYISLCVLRKGTWVTWCGFGIIGVPTYQLVFCKNSDIRKIKNRSDIWGFTNKTACIELNSKTLFRNRMLPSLLDSTSLDVIFRSLRKTQAW